MAPLFFNAIFNLSKYMVYESRDPVRSRQIHDTPQLTEWDRYAISGYFRLADPADDGVDDEADESEEDESSYEESFEEQR